MIKLVLAALLLGVNAWLAAAAFEPIARDGKGVEYILVSPSFIHLFVDVAVAAAALLTMQVLIFRRRPDSREPFLSPANTRHLNVIAWMALSLVPLFNLFGPLAARLPALSYVLFDLRFYWWPLVLVGMLRRTDPPLVRADWLHAVPQRWLLVSLVVIPVVFAIAFTPRLRFTGVLDGDEPKYLRYCENFYQGLGFDISKHRLLTELADGEPHVFDNIRRFFRAVPEEASLLIGDARRLVGAAAPPRLVAEPNMFFEGKHPGTVYQFHNPGLSFVLFPAYYLDRRVTGSGFGYQNEFPASMPAVYATLLALYAGYALALYDLLAAYGGNNRLAWVLALVGVVTLPAGAFAFQIYPEIAAGLIIFVLVRELIRPVSEKGSYPFSGRGSSEKGYDPFSTRPRAAATLMMGLLAGFLPWLHVRFGLATVVIVAWTVLSRARPLRTRFLFLLGAAAALGSFSLYTYRLTGGLLPTPPAGPEGMFSFARVVYGVPGFAFDRSYGLFSHTPVYLLALPGIWLAWRRGQAAAWILALIMAIVIPAASQGFQGAGATPGRYLVAVAPLLLLFVEDGIKDAITTPSRRRIFAAALVALTLVSLETAVRYNLNHLKGVGPLVAKEFSGWRLNLLFPSLGDASWPTAARDAGLLVSWLVVAVLLVTASWWLRRPTMRVPVAEAPALVASPRYLFGVLLAVALLGLTVGSLTGEMMDRAYFMPSVEARERLLASFAELPRCALCYSSEFGNVEPTTAMGNDVAFIDLRTEPAQPRAGEPVRVRVRPRSPTGEYVVSQVRLEHGDGSVATYRRLFGDVTEDHVYAQPGEYEVHAWVKASSDNPAEVRMRVQVVP